MWFAPKDAESISDVGRCRRHAPTMNGYPVVLKSDWCGDHKLSEQARAVEIAEAEKREMLKQEQSAMAAALQEHRYAASDAVPVPDTHPPMGMRWNP